MSFSVLIFPLQGIQVFLRCVRSYCNLPFQRWRQGWQQQLGPSVGHRRRDLAARTLVLHLGVETGSGMAPDNSPPGRRWGFAKVSTESAWLKIMM